MYNGHGDVTGLTDSLGALAREYDYDAFGNEREIAGQDASTDANPFRYAGEYFDTNSGTYYLRARNYNPATGRFLTEDTHWNPGNMIYGDPSTYPIPNNRAVMQSTNLYVYCLSNPILFIDPSGLAQLFGQKLDGSKTYTYKYQASNQIVDVGLGIATSIPIMGVGAQVGIWASKGIVFIATGSKIIELPNQRNISSLLGLGSTMGNVLGGLSLTGEALGYFTGLATMLGNISNVGTGLGIGKVFIDGFSGDSYAIERAVERTYRIVGDNVNNLKAAASWAEVTMIDMISKGYAEITVSNRGIETTVWHNIGIRDAYYEILERIVATGK